MAQFPINETNYGDGTLEGLRHLADSGLKVDFDEFAPDASCLGLWHLHDGAHEGEGTGLLDASDGHDFTNHGAASVEAGYEFDRADGDYMDADYPGEPARSQVTLEAWVRDWQTPSTERGLIALYGIDGNDNLYVRAALEGTSSRIRARLHIGGTAVGDAVWQGADVETLLTSSDPWHVAVVLDSPNRLTLYVNGVQRAEDTTDIADLPSGDCTLRLGRWITGYTGYDLSAVVDEVRLSSAARYSADFDVYRLLAGALYTAPTFDGGEVRSKWDIDRTQTVPGGTALGWEVRAADALSGDVPDAAWAGWDGDPATLPRGRYIQWRARLDPDAGRKVSPAFAEALTETVYVGTYRARLPIAQALNRSGTIAQSLVLPARLLK